MCSTEMKAGRIQSLLVKTVTTSTFDRSGMQNKNWSLPAVAVCVIEAPKLQHQHAADSLSLVPTANSCGKKTTTI